MAEQKVAETPTTTTGMQRKATWLTGFLMSMGVVILILASAGPLAAQVGPVSIAIWGVSALLGIPGVLIYSELAGMYPDSVGGMTVCMGDAFDKFTKWPKIITMWSYWYGWVPAIAVMSLLIGDYVNQMFGTHFTSYEAATAVLIVLFVMNYFGIVLSERIQLVIALLTVAPLGIITIAAFFKGVIHFGNLIPFRPYGDWGPIKNPAGLWTSGISWLGIGAAYYVATWSSLAFECITVYVGEYKDPVKDTVKAAWTSGITVTVFYTLVALALVGVFGVAGFAENADYPFFKLCEAVIGGGGAKVAMLILCLGLFMMANTSFNGTARILYGMSMDDLNLKQWLRLSPNGFPWVAALFNVAVTYVLLSFELPVRIIAASNLAYMICIFMPIFAFIILRKTRPDHPRPYKLKNYYIPIAWFLGILYIVIIIPGAMLYGTTVMLTGCVITLGIVPLYLYRRFVQDRRAKTTA
ncbi:MAG: APC family permease [Deltaproteobacteria bacterium]